ncbi:MAG: hypothetical protein CL674_14290 [Bdellovibrionaceae bacterium]|nr:hypothetical protein [Pseudobdellovibrionaceae bacterium]
MFKILLISLFCFAAHAEEIDQMQNIYQLLSSKKEVKGTYRQEKNLKKLSLTLESSGQFEVQKDKLVWDQKKPIQILFTMTQDKMSQKAEDGKEEIFPKEKYPELQMFSGTMFCVMSGDLECVKKQFNIDNVVFEESTKEWSFDLEAKDQVIKKLISRLSFSGAGSSLLKISWQENSDNSTEIYFKEGKGVE